MNQSPSIKRNFFWNTILTVANMLFPLITFPYVSRYLQAESMGKVDFANSVVNYFIMFAALGIPTYGIRLCSSVRDNKKDLSKTVQELLFINIVTTLIAIFLLFVSIVQIPRLSQDKPLFYIIGINLILNAFGINWLYSALEEYRYISIRSFVFKIISLILIFLTIQNPEDYLKYAAISVFSITGSNILNFIHSRKYISYKYIGNYHIKRHLNSVVTFFATTVAISIYTNLDIVMLGFLSNNSQVGYYSAALKIRMVLATVVTALSTVVLPRLSYYAANGLDKDFHNLIKKSLNFTLVTAIPFTLFFTVCAKPCVLILSGNSFFDAGIVLQWLLPTVLFAGLSNVTGTQLLVPYKKEKVLLISIICGACADFLCNIFFISFWGAAGAAAATTIAEFIVLLVQIIFSKKILLTLLKDINYKSILISSAISFTVLILQNLIPYTNNMVYMMRSSVLYFGTYTLFLYLFKNPLIIEITNSLKTRRIHL